MPDIREWCASPATQEFRKTLEAEVDQIGRLMADGLCGTDPDKAGVKYIEMIGYIQGVRKVIDFLRGDDHED